MECILFGIFLNVYDFAEFAFFSFLEEYFFQRGVLHYITTHHCSNKNEMLRTVLQNSRKETDSCCCMYGNICPFPIDGGNE